MGMYDDIKYEVDCPNCGARVSGFQSKDGPCCFAELGFREVDNFYTSCKKCDAWIEFNLKEEIKQSRSIDDYKMEITSCAK